MMVSVQIVMMGQDDPKKCTAARIVKSGMGVQVRKASASTVLLDPFADDILLPKDGTDFRSVTALDCSWNRAEKAMFDKLSGAHRSLPPLLAGNPVNYSKIGRLTTAEALAGALYIMGHEKKAVWMLSGIKWGHTFFELNEGLLEDYKGLKSADGLAGVLEAYGIGSNN